MSKTPTPLLLIYQNPRGKKLGTAVALLAVLLLATSALVYSSGGIGSVYLHIVYLPIILAGFLLYRRGGVAAGLAAGLLLGPLMPLDVAAGAAQEPLNWLLRLIIFVLAGLFTGQLARMLGRRAEELAHSYSRTLRTFASLVASRDEQVTGHCGRIANNARAVGSARGLGRRELESLYWAGVLHDLGKVAIPDRILLKAGPLNDEEFEQIKSHCALGADLVAHRGDEFALVAEGIRSHHERWDGSGYPSGLAGSEVPLFGRVLGVVDVFEALTSERPYRKPVGVAAACELLRRESGGHFDPDIVETFLELLERGEIEIAEGVSNDRKAEGQTPDRIREAL